MHENSGGLGYLSCDTDCETDNPQWNAVTLETSSTLDKEYPLPLPSWCDAGLWTTLTPSLALSAAGEPFIAYDTKYETRCWYKDPARNDPAEYRFTQLWRAIRATVP